MIDVHGCFEYYRTFSYYDRSYAYKHVYNNNMPGNDCYLVQYTVHNNIFAKLKTIFSIMEN